MAFEPAQHSFITLEGVDGAGKSTQARLLARALELAGYQVVSLREPGGTAISEKIRALLLDPANTAMGDTCELLLYEAARAQLVHEVIAPALAAGKVVLCDRFYDSTTCYQAFADGLDRQMVRDANNLPLRGRTRRSHSSTTSRPSRRRCAWQPVARQIAWRLRAWPSKSVSTRVFAQLPPRSQTA